MNEKTRLIFRDLYQSIPTPEDKARFQNLQKMSRPERLAFIARVFGSKDLAPGVIDMILSTQSFDKADRIALFSGAIRQWVFNWIGV